MSEEPHGPDDPVSVERSSPEETFAILANEIRVQTLLVLMEHPGEALTFTDLFERVDADDPGGFHYHLDRLVGHFVRKTDSGYELAHAGKEIVGAIYAGTYTADATVDYLPLPEACITCGGSLYLQYADEVVRLQCEDCDRRSDGYPFPPHALTQFDRQELPDGIDRWMDLIGRALVNGFCPVCSGPIEGSLVADDSTEQYADFPAHVQYECCRCGISHSVPGVFPVYQHPTFKHFLSRHGIDVGAPVWRVWGTVGRPESDLVSADPPRLEFRISLEGEKLAAVLDETGAVVDIDWQSGGSPEE